MSATDRAAEIIGYPKRGSTWALQVAQALADAGLLVTDEIQAVLDLAVATFEDTADIPRHAWVIPELRDAIVTYLASRRP